MEDSRERRAAIVELRVGGWLAPVASAKAIAGYLGVHRVTVYRLALQSGPLFRRERLALPRHQDVAFDRGERNPENASRLALSDASSQKPHQRSSSSDPPSTRSSIHDA
jgi:hypothetical protein